MGNFHSILIDSQQGNKRESGNLEVKSDAVLFTNDLKQVEIPFTRLEISHGGNNRELIFFTDKHNQDFSLYTSEKKILNEAPLLAHPELFLQLKHIKKSRRKMYLGATLILSLLILAIGSLFLLKNVFVKSIAKKAPKEWEEKIGDNLFKALSVQYKFIKNDTLLNDLKTVAAPLLKEIEKEGTKVEFYFIQDASINAFALPGGKVVIQSGLIEHAKSWEELMGVVSHELAHVTQRHHLRSVINNLGLYLIISALVGDVSAIAGTVINSGGDLALLANSRGFETEADETGFSYLVNAHINPKGMIAFFETIKKESGNSLDNYTSFISTHPATDDRIEHLNKLLKKENSSFKTIDKNFEQFKKGFERIKK